MSACASQRSVPRSHAECALCCASVGPCAATSPRFSTPAYLRSAPLLSPIDGSIALEDCYQIIAILDESSSLASFIATPKRKGLHCMRASLHAAPRSCISITCTSWRIHSERAEAEGLAVDALHFCIHCAFVGPALKVPQSWSCAHDRPYPTMWTPARALIDTCMHLRIREANLSYSLMQMLGVYLQ